MNDTALLDELTQLAAHQIGLRIPDDARDRFAGMLRERAAHLGYASLKDYRIFLAGNQAAGEWEKFARAFTTGETFFFRDHGQFDLLRLRLLPELIEQHRHDKALRLWSAGCASGEEVYSLAMLVDMLLPERDGWDILILGTDIDSAAIAKARRAQYGKWSFRMVPPGIQQRYFHSDPQSEIYNPQLFVLDERIHRMVTFRVSNLVSDPFPDSASELHDMDLILCRNVFIYFEPAAVSAVAAKFAATLREGGYLLTAHTELTGHSVQELESKLFAEGVVYRRRVQAPAGISCPPPQPSDGTTSHSTRPPKNGNQVAGYPASGGGGYARAGEGVVAQAGGEALAPSLARGGRLGWGEVEIAAPAIVRSAEETSKTLPPPPAGEGWGGGNDALLKEARSHADRGEYEQAERVCRKILVAAPLAAAPYFLLAQLAQLRGDFNQAKECLNKAIYLDPRFVAAYLELAALCERAEDMPRAQTLRRAALGIVRAMPGDEIIEQYETTAGELTQWLAQWEHDVT
ncbi:MAG TPA: CheR family methyltransferase [Gallionella sp.]|nr:CheR family methyltransferase [Gallionella sp.]